MQNFYTNKTNYTGDQRLVNSQKHMPYYSFYQNTSFYKENSKHNWFWKNILYYKNINIKWYLYYQTT